MILAWYYLTVRPECGYTDYKESNRGSPPSLDQTARSCLLSPAMLPKIRTTITWFCLLSFAAISGLGEALHFLPGCGHAVSAGNGYLWMGRLAPGMKLGLGDGVTRIGCPHKNRSPISSEEQCPICQHFSFASSPVTGVVFVAVSVLMQAVPVPDCPPPTTTTAQAFQARAPPHV